MPIESNGEILYEVSELIQRLGIPKDTILSFIKKGTLKSQKIKKKTYVSQAELKAFFDGPGKPFCRRKKQRPIF